MSLVKRTSEEVDSVFLYAKLEAADHNPCAQSIYFSESLDNESIRLVELEDEVLQSLQEGTRLVIRGEKDDLAVLCTKNRTYDIKEAETSNLLLILPECSLPEDLKETGPQQYHRTVCATIQSYYELRPTKPKLRSLRKKLEENMYNGKECENDEDHQGQKYTFADLRNTVQASDTELEIGLQKLQACQVDGYWRLLDIDHVSQIVSHILNLCEANDWLTTGMPIQECFRELDSLYPRDILMHVMLCYSTTLSSGTEDADNDLYQLDEDKLCRFFAEITLRQADRFNLADFLRVWQECVPEGMKTDLVQIQDLCLIDNDSIPAVIWLFPVDNLPEDVDERFAALFKTKKKWTLDEITPFIRDMASEKTAVGALLTKYCRSSTQGGMRLYSSRKTS